MTSSKDKSPSFLSTTTTRTSSKPISIYSSVYFWKQISCLKKTFSNLLCSLYQFVLPEIKSLIYAFLFTLLSFHNLFVPQSDPKRAETRHKTVHVFFPLSTFSQRSPVPEAKHADAARSPLGGAAANVLRSPAGKVPGMAAVVRTTQPGGNLAESSTAT